MSIIVYSKEGCIYCDKAKQLLDELQAPYTFHVLHPTQVDYIERRNELFNKYNHRSFPIILVGDVFVGGFTDLQHSVATLQFHELATKIGINIAMDF